MNKKKDEIEDWDDFEEVDLSKKKYVSDDTRKKIGDSTRGRKHSGETIELMKSQRVGMQIRLIPQEKVIEQFLKVHGELYDYSKVNYVQTNTHVEIVCSQHGSFFMTPTIHKKGGICPECRKIKTSQENREKWIERFNKVHSNKYDYSKMEYKKNDVNIIIICPKHGEFKKTPSSHLGGVGCGTCLKLEKRKKIDEKELKKLFKEGLSSREIGKRFGVSHTLIQRIKRETVN